MAGDWIPMRVALRDTHQVFSIAEAVGLDTDTVVGKLLRVWGWFDQHTENGNAPVTLVYADRVADCAGFAQAMQQVGWLTTENGVMSVTEFEKYFSQSGKRRLLTARRVANFRKRKCNASALPTQPQPQPQQEIPTVSKARGVFVRPTVEEVAAYCAARGNQVDARQFVDYYTANGWKVGRNAMKDWQAAVHTWERNGYSNGKSALGNQPARRVAKISRSNP